jgi:hypothetical protein
MEFILGLTLGFVIGGITVFVLWYADEKSKTR